MRYENLNALYHGSAGSRKYFLSQSVETQLKISQYGAYIHSAADLHAVTDAIKKYDRMIKISEMPFKRHP
ncbi:MAG: hypothetical protein IJX39_09425 [Clostridia bacterium]|nr:hypothetical protein [Clostridia bacterium]